MVIYIIIKFSFDFDFDFNFDFNYNFTTLFFIFNQQFNIILYSAVILNE